MPVGRLMTRPGAVLGARFVAPAPEPGSIHGWQ